MWRAEELGAVGPIDAGTIASPRGGGARLGAAGRVAGEAAGRPAALVALLEGGPGLTLEQPVQRLRLGRVVGGRAVHGGARGDRPARAGPVDRKSTRLNSSHGYI